MVATAPLLILFQICHFTCWLSAYHFFSIYIWCLLSLFLILGNTTSCVGGLNFVSFSIFWFLNSKRKAIVIPWTILNRIYETGMLRKNWWPNNKHEYKLDRAPPLFPCHSKIPSYLLNLTKSRLRKVGSQKKFGLLNEGMFISQQQEKWSLVKISSRETYV